MNNTFTVLQNSGYEFVVFEDVMNKLKGSSSVIFNADDYHDIVLFEKLFKHVQWLDKYGCLSLNKPLFSDNHLMSFSCSKPDFVRYEILKKSDFDVHNVLVSGLGEAIQFVCGVALNHFHIR